MKKTVTYSQVMDKVEDAYRIFQSGNFYMPHRPTITHEKNTLLYMPCFMPDCFGTKFLTLFPENPAKGYPVIDGLMLFNDSENGKTLAILDAQYLTALRTGAIGGVGIRNFSRSDCNSVGIIGAGYQGFFQAIYASTARKINNI
jgi:ornithine cyclodeaminase/alanine dehydrogenase-like protein (mu-crystallin family)